MRKSLLSLILAVLIAASPLLMNGEGATSGGALDRVRLEVSTALVDHYAITDYRVSMKNPLGIAVEEVLTFGIPLDALLSNLSLRIGDRTLYAVVAPKALAQDQYDQAVKENLTGSLLTGTDRPNVFELSVNVGPEEEVELTLRYEQVIMKELGTYSFDLDLDAISGYSYFDNVSASIMIIGLDQLITVDTSKGSVSPYVERIDDRTAVVNYTSADPRTGDLISVNFTERALPVNGTMRTYIYGTDGYFMHVFSPELEDLGTYLPKDIIFVLDNSGSMYGVKIGQLKDAFGEVVNQLHPEDRFNLITFNTNVHKYNDALIEANVQNIGEASAYIDSIEADMSTNINEALLTALSMFDLGAETVPIIVFLTDGLPTEGVTDIPTIRENIARANDLDVSIYSLGFGNDVDFEFLRALSLENNGWAVRIPETNDASDMMTGFYDTISVPLLKDLIFSYSPGEFAVFPETLPSLFAGSEAVVVGRFNPTSDYITSTVTAQTSSGSRVFEQGYDVEQGSDMDYIARVWAQRMIRKLIDDITVEGQTQALVDQVVSIAMNYSFVTPYTAFVLVEPKEKEDGTDEPSEQDDKEGQSDLGPGEADYWDPNFDGVPDNDPVPIDDDDSGGDSWNFERTDGEANDLSLFPLFMIGVILVIIVVVGLIIWGFTRLREEDLLKQKNRRAIYDHIIANPGEHFRGIQKAVDLEVGVLSHHMNVLEKEQLIVSEQDGSKRRFWAAGVRRDDGKIRLSRVQENILKSIQKEPGITQSQIARAIGVSRKVVFYHVKFLRNSGMVQEEKVRMKTHYYPLTR